MRGQDEAVSDADVLRALHESPAETRQRLRQEADARKGMGKAGKGIRLSKRTRARLAFNRAKFLARTILVAAWKNNIIIIAMIAWLSLDRGPLSEFQRYMSTMSIVAVLVLLDLLSKASSISDSLASLATTNHGIFHRMSLRDRFHKERLDEG